jgi:hypothetical protein
VFRSINANFVAVENDIFFCLAFVFGEYAYFVFVYSGRYSRCIDDLALWNKDSLVMGKDIWQETEELVQEFQELGVSQLVNYIQFCYHLFPAKIFKEDRADYILSLQQSQDNEVNQPF